MTLKVKNKAQPKGDKLGLVVLVFHSTHTTLGNFSLADKLTVTQRSTYMTLSGSIAIQTKGSYKNGSVDSTIKA